MISSGSLDSANGVNSPEVAEDDHDLAAVALQERLVAGVQDQLGHLRWEEAPQTRGPLELRDLRLDAFLQLAIPCLQLFRLTANRVLIALDSNERLDPGKQLGLIEGLGDEVVGPGLDRPDLLLGVARGDHHDRQEGGVGVLADPPAHLVAVHAGHQDVQQDEVWLLRRAADPAPPRPMRRSAPDSRAGSAPRRAAGRSAAGRRRRGSSSLVAHARDPVGRKLRTCPGSSRTPNGFSRYPSKPARSARSRSSRIANAVTATTGTSWVQGTGPQLPQCLDAIDARELEIHEDEVRTALGCELDTLLARSCLDHLVAGVAEDVADELEVQLVVLDDEDAVAVAHRCSSDSSARAAAPSGSGHHPEPGPARRTGGRG